MAARLICCCSIIPALEDDEQALNWLCNPESEVSAHYFLHRDGTIVQLVDETKRAWHAGEAYLERRHRYQQLLYRY